MKILVVDDEQDICEILQYNLETEGFEVVTANSAEEALRLPLHEMSLILLDVMMGEMSGFQMARRLKDSPATAQIPIIFITALDGEDNLVKGLNIGADDYIAKPLSMKEVMARVRAVLRRTFAIDHSPLNIDHSLVQKEADAKNGQCSMVNAQCSRICYEGIVLDLNAKTVTLDGEALICTKLEFELLSFFLQHPRHSVFARRLAEILLATGCVGARPHGGREHHPTAQENRPLWQTNQDSCGLWLLL